MHGFQNNMVHLYANLLGNLERQAAIRNALLSSDNSFETFAQVS